MSVRHRLIEELDKILPKRIWQLGPLDPKVNQSLWEELEPLFSRPVARKSRRDDIHKRRKELFDAITLHSPLDNDLFDVYLSAIFLGSEHRGYITFRPEEKSNDRNLQNRGLKNDLEVITLFLNDKFQLSLEPKEITSMVEESHDRLRSNLTGNTSSHSDRGR